MSANESKVTGNNLRGEGRDCGNGDRFKDTGLCKNQGKQPQIVKKSGMSGVESKVFDKKNSNGRNKEMKRNDICKKPKFTGDCEDMKNCVFIGTKYVTGSEIAKMADGLTIKFESKRKKLHKGIVEQFVEFSMAKLKVMPGFNEIYTKKHGFTVALSGLSTESASDYRNHRIGICSFISEAYGRNYAIMLIPLFITTVKKKHHLVIFQEQQDEAVGKRGVSDNNDTCLAINADRNKNILFFHIITMETAFISLGLRGMVKILQSVNTGSKYFILITNNCAAILQSVDIHHAAAMVLTDILKVQDNEECDSLRSAVVACDELLQNAESLICFQTVAAGWRLAQAQTIILNQSAISIDDDESSRRQMMQTAKTSLFSKLLAHKGVHFAIFVDAVIRLNESGNRRQILSFKCTGRSIKDFYPEDSLMKQVGVGQTRRLQECAILLANKSDKIEIYGPRVKVGEMNKVAEKGLAVKEKMRRNCKRIFAPGCNVLINHQLIPSFPEAIFAKHGAMASEHAYSDGIEQLAALNGDIRMFIHSEIVTFGVYVVIEDIMSDEDKVIFVGGFEAGNDCKIGLHGSPSQFLDESLHDALSILMTIRCNIYTYLMDYKFKNLRSVILETENKARRSTALTMPEEEKLINLMAGKATSPKHDNEANAEDESFERKIIRKSSPTRSTMSTILIKKLDCLRDAVLPANTKGHVQCACEIDNNRMFTSLCKGVCSLMNFRTNSRHDNVQGILSESYDQQKCLSNIIEDGKHTISKECPVLPLVKGTPEIDAADRLKRLVCVVKNFLSDLEMRVRGNIMRIVSNTLRPLEEANVAHRKGIEEHQSKLLMRQGIQDWEQMALHQSIKLKVETDLMQNAKEILADTKELFRKYREGLKKLAGLKECLKQDEPVSECMLLKAETKSLEECQESLKPLQILSRNLNSTRDALRRKVTSEDEAAINLSINENMSKLNEDVVEELVRLGIENEQLRELGEQHTVYIVWEMLMDPKYQTYSNDNERKRFYQLLDITVMATNIMDQDLQLVRQKCWGISVNQYQKGNVCVSNYERSTKAISVIEHIIQASDAAHTMQYWNILKKWNKRLFYKIYISYTMGRSEKDPSIWGYKGHVLLSDKYILPGYETSNEYGIFGIAGIDYLSYENWREVKLKEGRDIEEMIRCELTSREKDLQSESENLEASLRREQQKSADYEIVPNLIIDVIVLAMSELKSSIAREIVLKGTMLSLTDKTENDIAESNCTILNHIKGQEANLMQQESLEGMIDASVLTMCQLDQSGRICIVGKAGYTVFGWSESEIIESTILMHLGKAHSGKHAQCVRLYLETGERHNVGKQRKGKNHLDETLMLAQRVKVSHNILSQDNKRRLLIEQNRTLSSSRNTQQINKCFVINSIIVSNMFENQDCQTEQMVDSVYTQGKVIDSFWTQRKRFIDLRRLLTQRKLRDTFKECVGCILFIQSIVPNIEKCWTIVPIMCHENVIRYPITRYILRDTATSYFRHEVVTNPRSKSSLNPSTKYTKRIRSRYITAGN